MITKGYIKPRKTLETKFPSISQAPPQPKPTSKQQAKARKRKSKKKLSTAK
jgi:hypothetical protein